MISCPFPRSCLTPSDYLNCSNLVTGVNQTKIFNAVVSMISTKNTSHNVVANYTIRVTWKDIKDFKES